MAQKSQSYDNVLKRLLENQSEAIVPLLLPDAPLKVVEELNIEVLIPPRRTDRVYKSIYQDELQIIHFEFESSTNMEMDKRLLVYHALLLEKHKLPVVSVIVYPFQGPMVTPPLREWNHTGKILTFAYRTLALWALNARTFLDMEAVPLYGLLPVMEGTSPNLLLHAFEKMVEYYKDDEELLKDEILCFKVLLQRAKRLPEEEIQQVQRRIRMFDSLLEEDPWVQAYGLRQKVKTMAESIDLLVSTRFPALRGLATNRVEHIHDAVQLKQILLVIFNAPSEPEMLRFLQALPPAPDDAGAPLDCSEDLL